MNFPQISKSGMGAHFVQNILKYNIKPSNFASQTLVIESLLNKLMDSSLNKIITDQLWSYIYGMKVQLAS